MNKCLKLIVKLLGLLVSSDSDKFNCTGSLKNLEFFIKLVVQLK